MDIVLIDGEHVYKDVDLSELLELIQDTLENVADGEQATLTIMINHPPAPVEPPAPKRGWAFSIHSKKAHYFVDGLSLCRKFGHIGGIDTELQDDNHDSPDNCATCKKKRSKKYASEKPPKDNV